MNGPLSVTFNVRLVGLDLERKIFPTQRIIIIPQTQNKKILEFSFSLQFSMGHERSKGLAASQGFSDGHSLVN